MRSGRKRPYRWWLLLPALLAAAVLLWQAAVMAGEAGKERETYQLVIRGEEGISSQTLEALTGFPGVTEAWSALRLEGQLTVGDYSGPVTVWGVDLDTYPMKLLSTAGAVSVGGNPALVVGAEALGAFQGQDGKGISQSRLAQLEESYPELSSSLALDIWAGSGGSSGISLRGSAGGFGTDLAGSGSGSGTDLAGSGSGSGADLAGIGNDFGTDLAGSGSSSGTGLGDSQAGGSASGTNAGGAAGSRPAAVLGLAEGPDCYMDQEQMQAILRAAGESVKVRQVLLKVKGRTEAEKLKKAAGEAGLILAEDK